MFRKVAWMAASIALSAALLQAAPAPRRSPEFGISLNTGKQVLLSQYRGKVVAMMFILTYCSHCQHTVEIMKKLQVEYGPRGFQTLASAIEDMASMAVPDFLKRFQPNFPVGFNDRKQVVEYLQLDPQMRLMMPQLALVDREGTIRAQYAGDDPFFGAEQEANLRARIGELLKESNHNGRKSAGARTRKRPS